MSTRYEPPLGHRPDVRTESSPALRGCLLLLILVAIAAGAGLWLSGAGSDAIEELAEKARSWIDSAQEDADDISGPPVGRDEEDEPPSAELDSGQVIVGDFQLLTIEEIWAAGDVEAAMTVAIENDPDWLRRLLEQEGVDPNIRLTHGGSDGWNHPLEKAVRQGSQETFEILLAAGADPNGQSSDGDAALHAAAWKGYLGIVQQLVAHGADPNLLAVGQHDEINAQRMRDLGQEYEPGVGAAVIERAALQGHADVVAYLLGQAVEPRYALHAAASHGSVELIQLLLDHGADPKAKTVYGDGPLRHAAGKGHLGAVELLLGAGARPGEQAQREAAQRGHDEVIRAFAAAGVRFDVPPAYWDPLYSAAHAGQLSTVELLLELGASPHAGEDLDAPIDAAREQGHEEIVALLAAAGAE